MKRKVAFILVVGLLMVFALSSCGQKDIGAGKAKEFGLAYINKIFGANETEATVSRDIVECLPYQAGAVVTGDPSIGTRVVYYLRVAKVESMPEYEALINGSTGEVYYAWRTELSIKLTEEQIKEASARTSKSWGKNKDLIYEDMRQASIRWVSENLMDKYPVLFGAQNSDYDKGPINPTFKNSYYVVMQDGTAYEIVMQWPSMQVLSVSWVNEQ